MSPAERGPVVGHTGARFGSSRRRRAAEAEADAVESRAADVGEGWAAEIPRARRPDAAETLSAGPDETRAPAPERAADDGEAGDEPPPPSPVDAQRAADDDGLGGVRVRPYVRTGGRTRPAVDLAIEALVATAPGAPEPPGADHRAIAALCASPRSVAEIAALLEVPLGVARVLVADLAQDGGVVVHDTSGPDGPDPTLMQRVLDGLRRL